MKKRDTTIDIAKGIGIILVVFAHTQFPFNNIIYQFHMPLFFFLSGMVFNENNLIPYRDFAMKKIKGLYLPFIKFEMVFCLLHNVFCYLGIYSTLSNKFIIYNMKDFISQIIKIFLLGGGESLVGPLWFLISSLEIVFLFSILVLIFKNAFKMREKYQLLVFISSIILFVVGCHTDLPRMMSQSFIGLFFYCIGFLYKKNRNIVPFRFSFACLAGTLVIAIGMNYVVDISQLQISSPMMFIISSIAGIYVILYISIMIKPGKIVDCLTFCGRNTIYILALHLIAFKSIILLEIFVYHLNWDLLGITPTYEINRLWEGAFTISGVIIPLLYIFIRNKIVRSVRYYVGTKKIV